MSRKELEDWLQTDESKEVGQKDGETEGHESGRRIVELLEKRGPTTPTTTPTTCAASSPTSTATRLRIPKRRTSKTPTCATRSCDIQMQRNSGLRVYATPAKEPEVELALVYRLRALALLTGLCSGTRLLRSRRELGLM